MTAPNEPAGVLGIAVLGSTGSVGQQVIDVIDAHPDRFRVATLAARTASELFLSQVRKYRPAVAAVSIPAPTPFEGATRSYAGTAGLLAAATSGAADIVVVATSGHDAIGPTLHAIELGKTIALANKETLVCAGGLMMPLAKLHGVEIRPVDSEHSAIWQALGGALAGDVRRVILTASGGPFRSRSLSELAEVSIEDALAHPIWSMGGKITIDSATMMNKGLEIIEAHWLFDVPYDRIDVLVHPESIVHSLVEFIDGSQIAQLGVPDMRTPIRYALSYPYRLDTPGDRLDLAQAGSLTFEEPNDARFPCLRLAREAGMAGGTYPTALSAADDVAVAAFLNAELRFSEIPLVIEEVVGRHDSVNEPTLEDILNVDTWARKLAAESIKLRACQ
jgi:1-deoxy-D-xylulose-5-phosphate reductoisomerase